MWIALGLVLGVMGGVGWLAALAPPCMRCQRRGHCDAQASCLRKAQSIPEQPVLHYLSWPTRQPLTASKPQAIPSD